MDAVASRMDSLHKSRCQKDRQTDDRQREERGVTSLTFSCFLAFSCSLSATKHLPSLESHYSRLTHFPHKIPSLRSSPIATKNNSELNQAVWQAPGLLPSTHNTLHCGGHCICLNHAGKSPERCKGHWSMATPGDRAQKPSSVLE